MGYIIAADEIKKLIPGYMPSRSEEFHKESAKIADKMYNAAVNNRSEPSIILLSGGTASGKSEYVSEYLTDEDAIILDGTLPSLQGAKIKIDKALKAGKKVVVHAILPKSFYVAFLVFLSRERKFDVSHFYRTHSNSRATLLAIANYYPQVEFRIVTSEYIEMHEDGSMKFKEIQFDNRDKLLEFLAKEQYNEKKLRNEIIHYASHNS